MTFLGRRYVRQSSFASLWLALLTLLTILYLIYWTIHSFREQNSQNFTTLKKKRGCFGNICTRTLLKSTEIASEIYCQNCSTLQAQIEALEHKLKVYEKVGKLTEDNSLVNNYGSKVRQNILLISCLHCGSSFLGEMLNQHPDVFYLDEPVESLEYYRENRPESVYETMVTHLLNGIFHCDFRELNYLTDFLSLQYSSLRRRLASRALSLPPLCPSSRTHPSFNIRMCTRLRSPAVSAICNLHKHTVVKSVQVDFIHKLSYLMDSQGPADYALKVVHLVRDPRALIDAQVGHVKGNWTLTSLRSHSKTFCNDLLLNIKYAVSAPPWLQGRYTLLRYEDLATKPHQISEQLYQFVGIAIASQVRRWIDRAHKESVPSFSGMSDTVLFSSSLNMRKSLVDSVNKWRERMPYSVVRIIETECYEVMNLLGYKVVEDEEELRTITLPLVD